MTDERLRIWLNFWKWLVSTVVVTGGIAVATTVIDAKHKNTELRIRLNQEEKDYLVSFLDRALDVNLEKRYRFAQYFAHVTASEEYKKGWNSYLVQIEEEIRNKKQEKLKLEDKISQLSGRDLERARERLAELERELKFQKAEHLQEGIYHSLHSFDSMASQRVECREGEKLAVWHETVLMPFLPEFSAGDKYIALGCRDEEGTRTGRFVAFYPDGSIVEESELDGKTVVYYRSGRKAIEGQRIGGNVVVSTIWSPDGERLVRRRLRAVR